MSWQKVKLKEVLKQYRVQHIVQDDIEYKQVTISKYDGVTFRGTKIGKDIGRKRQFVIDLKKYPDTLMLVRQGVQDGSIGIAPAEVDGCIATENMPMFSVEGIDLEYLRFLLKSPYFYDELNKIETTGSAQKSIHERQILEIEIPLPNLDEQKQFVTELTKLKNGGLEISSELTHQLDLIKQLRQAFLREAMQGKLVKSTNTKETGQQLLTKIKAEKSQLIAVKKLKKEKVLAPISEDEIPFEIPEHWAWCRLGEISNFISGTNFNSSDFKKGEGVKCIKITNAGVGELIETDDVLPYNFIEKYSNYIVYQGDLILALTRPYIAEGLKISKCNNVYNNSLLNQRVALIRNYPSISNEYVYKYLRSDYVLNKYKSMFEGKGQQPNLKKEDVTELLFPLPPLHEQEQIVAKLEELMKFCDGLEQSIKESQGYNEMLLQQVLREALQGGKV